MAIKLFNYVQTALTLPSELIDKISPSLSEILESRAVEALAVPAVFVVVIVIVPEDIANTSPSLSEIRISFATAAKAGEENIRIINNKTIILKFMSQNLVLGVDCPVYDNYKNRAWNSSRIPPYFGFRSFFSLVPS